MNIQFTDLIGNSPAAPGVYKMHDADGNLLYVGKAKDISARLKQYNDISKLEPHKQVMRSLVASVVWEITKTESDALILEQQLIKSEKPKYNIMMTDDKMYPMLALTDNPYPRLTKFRGKISQKKDVFGPYPSVAALNETMKIIQKVCQIRVCTDSFMKNRARPCILYQIGRCSAPCTVPQTSYSENIALARRILTGNAGEVVSEMSAQMDVFSKNMNFEAAAKLRDKIFALSHTGQRGVRTRGESFGTDFDARINDMEKWLGIKINTVCVFDNSHLFGKNAVGGMIVFGRDGFIKQQYRHYKLKDKAVAGNDIAMMDEFIGRMIKKENKYDLIIVDGGLAQWNIANRAAAGVPILGVVKGAVRNGDEHFIKPGGDTDDSIPKDSALFLFLRRARDEAHRFVISFHRASRAKSMIVSQLDEIEGIGPARKKALLHHFGSVRAVSAADLETLIRVPGLGESAAQKIYSYFHP